MDFLKESQNGEQFYQKNNGWKEIRSPKIYDAFCSKKVIVMEEMSGKNLNHLMNAENKTETFNHWNSKQAAETRSCKAFS